VAVILNGSRRGVGLRDEIVSIFWEIVAFFIALAVTILFTQVTVFVTGWLRRRDFRHFEDKSKQSIARQFPIPANETSPAEERRKALSPCVDALHKKANDAQTVYHNAVVRSAGCLAVGFIAMVLGSFSHEDWIRATSHYEVIEEVLNWIDAIAVISVLLLYLFARSASPRWIEARAVAELMRQYQFLEALIPGQETAGDVKARFYHESSAVRERMAAGSISAIISRIEAIWSERKASLEKRTLTDQDLLADALLLYLQRRARRQLGWFADSQARLEHIAERLNWVLLALYCLAALLAVIKLALILSYGHSPPYLLRLLLVATGMSGAMTAYYINQNARSLVHRYHTQQRRIISWLNVFNERWHFASLSSQALCNAAKSEIRASILQFEALMIEELADWVHITSSDAIELAP
jgi:hypothetical protein